MFSRFVIVTGMSGAGKRTALKAFEDAGYFCVDNLPVSLIKTFVQLILSSNDEKLRKVSLGVDIRGGDLAGIDVMLYEMKHDEIPVEVVFLDASDDILLKRYKETRRSHPLMQEDDHIEDGIREEREQLRVLRKKADYIIDTSKLLTRELKKALHGIFTDGESFKNMMITVMSFGFKFGIPQDADLVFDVRFLPNPYYLEELKKLSGNDPPVSDYVMGFDAAKLFVSKLVDMLNFMIPHYIDEGKNRLIIAIGCTGGRHRSVTLANEVYRELTRGYGSSLRIEHRDLPKDVKIKGF